MAIIIILNPTSLLLNTICGRMLFIITLDKNITDISRTTEEYEDLGAFNEDYSSQRETHTGNTWGRSAHPESLGEYVHTHPDTPPHRHTYTPTHR